MIPALRSLGVRLLLAAVAMSAVSVDLRAHAGPPFPIVSNQVAGVYDVSIWTDPDSTGDGVAAGRFWVVIERAGGGGAAPAATQVTVSVRPLDRPGPTRRGRAAPADGPARWFVLLLLDHEGRFAVQVQIDGPLGRAELESVVEATDDLRPPAFLLAVYAFPFLALGLLWGKVLLRRRRAAARARSSPAPRTNPRA